ncbi:hypothetical protein HK097_003519 [Rhizophlyctis rosea]|uniref:Uncharacterized protein n=1 Tax=Rhizophlyctis rosea TaxID=64517 RepID=A0AAD5WX67_9FUNG|nr:hypothetical protein HK097_003519 [Rhizophlyctis rosea]
MDETLCLTIDAVSRWHNATYGTSYTLSSYSTYDWSQVWGTSLSEAQNRIRQFQQSPYYLTDMQPVPGAKEALTVLSAHYTICLVTAREHFASEATHAFLNHHYPGLVSHVYFANQNMTAEEVAASHGTHQKPRTKLEILQQIGARVLVDDSLEHMRICASGGVRVFLFDLEGQYKFNKIEGGDASLPKGVTRVTSWKEVADILVSDPHVKGHALRATRSLEEVEQELGVALEVSA